MAQVTIYLDGDTNDKMDLYLGEASVSKSAWISGLIKDKLADTWPADFMSLAGSCADFPDLDDIRSGLDKDFPRESF